ncbi:MAG: phosphoglycerate kinase [Candidatus Parcubacteria bacterium]|nr:MAG: phosphoglycerate kinase [Candidatus Parcubacteria bacterium]
MIILKKNKLLKNNLHKTKNKNVILRVDFNIDLKDGHLVDKYRLNAAKATIYALKQTANKIIIISHLENNKFKSFKKFLPFIEKFLKQKIVFCNSLNKDIVQNIKNKIIFIENIRLWPGEKANDLMLAKQIKELGDVFVNEAFSVSHRKHSSVYWLPKLMPTFYGLNFEKEIKLLNTVLKQKRHVLILGGAKISTKLPLIKKFLQKKALVILGGGLANTVYKAYNFKIGKSLIEKNILNDIKKINNENLILPIDFYVLSDKKIFYRRLDEIKNNDIILDIGDKSLDLFKEKLQNNKYYIVWNGPLGYVENQTFQNGTLQLAKFLITKNKNTVVGGGDTIAFLESHNLMKKFKNISTGGGAMLHYLAFEKLSFKI